MTIATIRNATGETAILARDAWYGLPYVSGTRTKCGYWESRCDLFLFACEQAGFEPENSEWIDGATGEILGFYDLSDEETALFESAENY